MGAGHAVVLNKAYNIQVPRPLVLFPLGVMVLALLSWMPVVNLVLITIAYLLAFAGGNLL